MKPRVVLWGARRGDRQFGGLTDRLLTQLMSKYVGRERRDTADRVRKGTAAS